ncbi:hypothetical protein T439DRAFT_325816 [Meredithblackwellia eburnea MCA 4105]
MEANNIGAPASPALYWFRAFFTKLRSSIINLKRSPGYSDLPDPIEDLLQPLADLTAPTWNDDLRPLVLAHLGSTADIKATGLDKIGWKNMEVLRAIFVDVWLSQGEDWALEEGLEMLNWLTALSKELDKKSTLLYSAVNLSARREGNIASGSGGAPANTGDPHTFSDSIASSAEPSPEPEQFLRTNTLREAAPPPDVKPAEGNLAVFSNQGAAKSPTLSASQTVRVVDKSKSRALTPFVDVVRHGNRHLSLGPQIPPEPRNLSNAVSVITGGKRARTRVIDYSLSRSSSDADEGDNSGEDEETVDEDDSDDEDFGAKSRKKRPLRPTSKKARTASMPQAQTQAPRTAPHPPYEDLPIINKIKTMIPNLVNKVDISVIKTSAADYLSSNDLSFSRKDLGGNQYNTSQRGLSNGKLTPSDRHICLQSGFNIVSTEPGDPVVIFSARSVLSEFITNALHSSSHTDPDDTNRPPSINIFMCAGANDWRYKGAYSVQKLSKVKVGAKTMEWELYAGETPPGSLLNLEQSPARKEGVQLLFDKFSRWEKKEELYKSWNLGTVTSAGVMAKLEHNPKARLCYIVLTFAGWDSTSFGVWAEKRKERIQKGQKEIESVS